MLFEFWKRTQATICHLWDMDEMNSIETEMEGFKHDKAIDENSGKVVKQNFVNTYIRKLTVTLPTVIFSVGVVISVFVAYRILYRST
jgi:hypothetical protein